MKEILTIVFTYKRAALLDQVLIFLKKNFKNSSKLIHVIYHSDPQHEDSYCKLIKKWKKKNIIFHERKKISLFKIGFLKFFRPLNLLWLLRWPQIFKDFNNFKFILEKIINSSKSKFVTMVTDDQIFYKKTFISDYILNKLTKKRRRFYRFFTGDHFKDDYMLPRDLDIKHFKSKHPIFFSWKTVDPKATSCWKYTFTVDGTVYFKEDLLKLIMPMIYHNPITLEAIGLWESRFRNFFKIGYSAKQRTAAHYQINNVQKLVQNQCSDFDPDLIMKLYLKGYSLFINNIDFKNEIFNILPKKLFFIKGKNKIEYSHIKI